MPTTRLEYLFQLYVSFKCTTEEEEELMDLLAQSELKVEVEALIEETIKITDIERRLPDLVSASILNTILEKEKLEGALPERRQFKLRYGINLAAAAIIIFALVSFWFSESNFFNKKDQPKVVKVEGEPGHILPGGNRAVLTMADGRTIILDSLKNGMLPYENAKIDKQEGILVYEESPFTKPSGVVAINTLSTPRGGQYQVVLPDGSKVWLNAASSLKFPTHFIGKLREVELSGEAYFEVAKNKEKPFKVKVNGMSINVIGTRFNVNSYEEERSVRTSLLEGSVQIIKDNIRKTLKPGNQAILHKKQDIIDITAVDMEGVMAWKNGLFLFEGADITTIMQDIGRWYNVEIVYSGKVPARSFEGKISREADLSEVLRILELSNVKFSIVGKRIIVQ